MLFSDGHYKRESPESARCERSVHIEHDLSHLTPTIEGYKKNYLEMLLLRSPFSLRGWGQGEIEKVPSADVIKNK